MASYKPDTEFNEYFSKELRDFKDEIKYLLKEISNLKEEMLKNNTKLESKISSLEVRINSICEQLGNTITKNGARAMEERISSIEKDSEQSYEALEERLDNLNKTLSEKIDSLKEDVDKLEKKVDTLSETSAMSKVYFSIVLVALSALFSFVFSVLIPKAFGR